MSCVFLSIPAYRWYSPSGGHYKTDRN